MIITIVPNKYLYANKWTVPATFEADNPPSFTPPDRVLRALEKCGVLQEISSDLTFHSIHDAVAVITCAEAHQAKDDLQKS